MNLPAIDFIDFNSENSTPAFYHQSVQENNQQSWFDESNIRDRLSINLVPFPQAKKEEAGSSPVIEEVDVSFDKRCNDRLILLARAYGKNQASENQREVMARIEMIESEIDSKVPRYSEKDWQLLEDFKESLSKLTGAI